MSDTVIQVDNLCKKYRLGVIGTGTLRHDFNRWWHRVRGKDDPYAKVGGSPKLRLQKAESKSRQANGDRPASLDFQSPNGKPRFSDASLADDEMWALRGVSFEVKQGEILGVIGRNGAGKSTLLKILSRVTAPTSGEVRVKGRIASLLEVGTGFHPELTGRENIFLNGAILGMTKAEIKEKFDEIVAFADVEKFLDTPVKRYSSGMYVRLAFAVAAHLEPEILIVDEVLAVGDAEFQKKCLGKMQEVAQQGGRTVLFVSHNMAAVARLCSQGLILSQGSVECGGSARQAVGHYTRFEPSESGLVEWLDDAHAPATENIRLRSVRISFGGHLTREVSIERPFDVQIEFQTLKPGLTVSAGLHLLHPLGGEVLSTVNWPCASLEPADHLYGKPMPLGRFMSKCTIPGFFLNEGEYSLNVVLFCPKNRVDLVERQVIQFRVIETGAMRGEWTAGWIGVVRPRLAWQSQRI